MAKKERPEKQKETLGEIIRSFLFMVFLALVFRSIAFEPFHIPSGSMLSTLYEGDYIFVSKLPYGYSKFSFPFSPDFIKGRIWESKPERGDVAVFRNPSNVRVDYIKRIIGMPGETVQMKRGRLYIDGKMIEQTRSGEVELPNQCGDLHKVARYEEVLPNGVKYMVLDDSAELDNPNRKCNPGRNQGFDPDNTGLYKVPEGHYFMMGDNRDHSQDSRFSRRLGFNDAPGYVPIENFVGRADLIAFSLKGLKGRWLMKI